MHQPWNDRRKKKEHIHERLGSCTSTADMDTLILLGDVHARVGKDWNSWPNAVEKHMHGKMNSKGLMLLKFCTRFQLSIIGTMFQLKDCLTNIGQHLRSKHWHQLDHVLTNKSAKHYVTVTKVNREANCFTDYRLLILSVSSPLRARRELQDLPRS